MHTAPLIQGLDMRLHSVKFKRASWSREEEAARADFVRDLMSLHGCYLEKVWFARDARQGWVARYE